MASLRCKVTGCDLDACGICRRCGDTSAARHDWAEAERKRPCYKRLECSRCDEVNESPEHDWTPTPSNHGDGTDVEAILSCSVACGFGPLAFDTIGTKIYFVVVVEDQMTNPSGSQVQGDGRAEPAEADDQGAGVEQHVLSRHVHLGEHDLAAVTKQLLVIHGRCPIVTLG